MSQQFTPAQILDVGRRAEQERRFDLARQFYRHLLEHHPQSQEASAARDALQRLGSQSGGPQPQGPLAPQLQNPSQPRPPAALNGAAPGHVGMNGHEPHPQPQQRPAAAAPPSPAGAAPPGAAAPHAQQPPGPATPPPAAAPAPPPRPAYPGDMHQGPIPVPHAAPAPYAPRPVLLPEPLSLYRTGRAIARFIAVIGWVLAILLPVVAVAFLVTQRPLLMAVTPVSSGVKPVLFVVATIIAASLAALPGLLMVFSAQMARAVFHTSIAAQDLVAIERARNAAGR